MDEFRQLQRIQYREARPSGNLTDLDFHDFFNVKSGHWSYEREWRIIRAIVDADKTNSCEQNEVHLFNFPPDALTSVIFGARTPITVIDEV
ncbi:hypothetical protein GKO28_12510 [Deefgea sp. CFH1-16]|nr:hypothetical protein [Deefgea sp. CFH1-16]